LRLGDAGLFQDDNQKGKGKSNGKSNGKSKSDLRVSPLRCAPVEMTISGWFARVEMTILGG
jgi:hypothetical protein